MDRQAFPSGMAYLFENPDDTYPSPTARNKPSNEVSLSHRWDQSLKQRLKSCLKAARQHGVQVGALLSEGEGTRGAEKEDGAADEGGDTEESGASEEDARGLDKAH